VIDEQSAMEIYRSVPDGQILCSALYCDSYETYNRGSQEKYIRRHSYKSCGKNFNNFTKNLVY
jgi:hypothetical protein